MNYPGLPTSLKDTGKVIFEGKASIPLDCDLNVGGTLHIGDNFSCSQGVKIDAKSDSYIGADVLIGHKCYLSDDDGHRVYSNNRVVNEKNGYYIGNHVWFGREAKVLKGTNIPSGCVIAAGAICNKKYEKANVLLAGIPAREVKQNIKWEK